MGKSADHDDVKLPFPDGARLTIVEPCEPLSDAEWREWLRDADDDELRAMVRDFKTKAASDCEAELDRRAEAAYDRMVEDYYGGDGPQTERERAEVAVRS
jgi:hypothetical protein